MDPLIVSLHFFGNRSVEGNTDVSLCVLDWIQKKPAFSPKPFCDGNSSDESPSSLTSVQTSGKACWQVVLRKNRQLSLSPWCQQSRNRSDKRSLLKSLSRPQKCTSRDEVVHVIFSLSSFDWWQPQTVRFAVGVYWGCPEEQTWHHCPYPASWSCTLLCLCKLETAGLAQREEI